MMGMATVEFRTFTKINPSTGLPIREYHAASEAEVRQAVHRSREAFAQWQNSNLRLRARLLKKTADRLYKHADEIAAVISEETGKPLGDALTADIGTALNVLNYYAEIGPKRLRPRNIRPDLVSLITCRSHREVFHPRGVIGIISPWNYPLAIPASGMAAALMTGNTAVLKPSELAPATGQILVDVFREAAGELNLPADIIQVLLGDGETGSSLTQQEIDGIIFTGSDRTGRRIQNALSERNIWSSLELGGSDAMIILPGCNLETAASYAVWGRFTNTGQACASVKRLFVPATERDGLIGHLQDKMTNMRIGPPSDVGNHIGPLISETQLQVLEAQVEDALKRGARLIVGGKRLPREGWFYAPTLLTDVPPEARILHEEVFGPVLPVLPYKEIDEAIRLTNASEFGLTASLFGPEPEALSLANRLECATVVINDVGTSNYAMACAPWGGWKSSGTGVSHGERALLELCKTQVISQNGLFRLPGFHKPLWHFSSAASQDPLRSKAVLAFSARHLSGLNPFTWLAFWHHRASKKL
jgi:succinate-semialdehyde dehydrogenase/glutarate-semialdehyde dehydrogenase